VFQVAHITIFILLLLGCSSPTVIRVPGNPVSSLSISQGYTTNTSTILTVLRPKEKPVKYFIRSEYADEALDLRNFNVQTFDYNKSDWVIDRIKVTGLTSTASYGLEVRNNYDELIDTREFSALNLNTNSVRFAAASCADQEFTAVQKRMWFELLERRPQIIFLLGDNTYASKKASVFSGITPEKIWASYVESRLILDLYRTPKLIPTLAIWDDNDYGANDGHRDFKYRKESADIFRTFYGQEPDSIYLFSGPGTAKFLNAFHFNFALMDNRFHRSPNKQSKDETHWGHAQESWLIKNLKTYRQPTWILNGDQIFGGYHDFESYEGSHNNNFKVMMRQISTLPQPIAYLTGDRHMTEVMKISESNISTFEITTSPIHGKLPPNPWKATPNQRQIEGRAEKYNYLIINAENKNNNLTATITAFSMNNEILFNRFISIENSTKKLKTY
jgi:alkaline phosphatase D